MWIYPADNSHTVSSERKPDFSFKEPLSLNFSDDEPPHNPRPQGNRGFTPIPHPEKPKPHHEKNSAAIPASQNSSPANRKTTPAGHPVSTHIQHKMIPSFTAKAQVLSIPFFAVVYALGTLSGGILHAVLPEMPLRYLQLFLKTTISMESLPPFELFAALFTTALVQITVIVLTGFSVFGGPLNTAFIFLCGSGTGLSTVELLLADSASGTAFDLLFRGLYQAFVAATLCYLAQSGTALSALYFRQTFAPSAPENTAAEIKKDTADCFRRYLYTIIVLILFCGLYAAAAGFSMDPLLY